MPIGAFVLDKMGKEEINPIQVSQSDWEKGTFKVRTNGQMVTAQRRDLTNPVKGNSATHVVFRERREAAKYKQSMFC